MLVEARDARNRMVITKAWLTGDQAPQQGRWQLVAQFVKQGDPIWQRPKPLDLADNFDLVFLCVGRRKLGTPWQRYRDIVPQLIDNRFHHGRS